MINEAFFRKYNTMSEPDKKKIRKINHSKKLSALFEKLNMVPHVLGRNGLS